jgi:hypothetical protein
MEKDRTREIANAAGLTALDEKHLAQLAKSIESSREAASKLPTNLHWSEEIALVFRLPTPAGHKP